ncbi:hypothetical protein DB347_20100 [Opitutaceae bacterium EW11]|nr:hypothetical protein DB347_20100 [Opitutaceae bacterium EW11]
MGDIYVAGSDHRTNSALYFLKNGDDTLTYVGDARAASEEVANWQPAETAEKFHVRPTFFRGRVYVATSDYSRADGGYLKRRGFHWYAYDEGNRQLVDLSSVEPGGVGGAHASIFALAVDAKNGLLYGHDSPRGHLYRYDIEKGKTTNLGRPSSLPEGFYMPGRYIWVNRDGRVYFTISKCEYVQYYDPHTGFGERKDVSISDQRYPNNVFRTGTRSLDGRYVWVADREAHIWRYDDATDKFAYLGQAVGEGARNNSKTTLKIRCFNVSADGKKLYLINDDAQECCLWEYDLISQKTQKLCALGEFDERLGAKEYINHCGNDTWDGVGNFYFCSFGGDTSESTDLIFSRLNPVRMKVSLGILPEYVEVSAKPLIGGRCIIERTGSTKRAQDVIIKEVHSELAQPRFCTFTIPAGEQSVEIPQMLMGVQPVTFTVMGNGNDYCAARANPCEVKIDD